MTKTKTCKLFFKKSVFSLIFAAFFLSSTFLYSAETKKWTLGAEAFSFRQKNVDEAVKKTSEMLPGLILEQMNEYMNRRPRSQELMERQLYEYQKERLSLFLQLSKEYQVRDALFLNDYSERKLKSKIREEDKKIAAIEEKIADNLKASDNEKKKRLEKLENDRLRLERIEKGDVVDDEEKKRNGFQEFFRQSQNDENTVEQVVLYKNDFHQLFDSSAVKKYGVESYEFSKACADVSINGLITGEITVYGSYVSVNTTLYIFPGGFRGGHAAEVGEISDLKSIASSLAQQLTPKISDHMPVELSFEIEPEEARKNAVISIDDVIYQNDGKKITIPGGVHSIHVASKGYTSEATVFSFEHNRLFNIKVTLDEEKYGNVTLALKKPYSGDLFASGIFQGKISETERLSNISVDNRNILGHFVSENGAAADFTVSPELLTDGNELIVDARPFDRSANIEKRRIWMYRSYSLLIVSLIPTFYTLGNFTAANQAYANGNGVSYEDCVKWQTANNICSGISIGCGVLFGVELFRYFKAANDVLPAKAKKISPKQKLKIQKEMEKAQKNEKQSEAEKTAGTDEQNENQDLSSKTEEAGLK